MKPDIAQSREAVRRAGKATKLLLTVSVGLLTALGAIFAHLMTRQAAMQESVAEDSLWAVYQLDREARTLSQTIDHLGPLTLLSRNDLSALTLRYDILYSRISVLETTKYNVLFESDPTFGKNRALIRQAILDMAPFFDEITKTDRADRNMLAPTDQRITDLLKVTETLLTYTNTTISAARADTRNEVMRMQRLSAFIVLVLALTISLLLLNLMRQVKALKTAAGVLENTAQELTAAYEAAEAGNRAKSEFMATMGHEIRTPLNAILGMAEILSHSSLAADDRANVGVITSSGTALLEMLNEILDFAKIEHGGLTSESLPFDVRLLATQASHIVDGRARERGNRLDLLLDAVPGNGWYMGDPTLIQRVLLNLLSNAVKFTENGIVRVRISEDADTLRFEVADSGIGISAAAQGRLFSAFSQVDGTIGRRFGGTGLGLAICKRIVEELGGRIGVDSTPSLGSRFWFELPAVPCEAPPQDTVAPAIAARTLPALRILVVEDHPINRKVAAKFLEMLGQTVVLANDGSEGVEAAAAGGFDLILMDMQMPVMDGIAAARAIRASGNPVPIIAMTANASDHDRKLCSEAGMDGFEAKPITIKRLSALLAGITGDRPADAILAPAATPPAAETRDPSRVQELVMAVGEDGLAELTAMFFADLPALLDEIGAATSSADIEQLDRALHAIKGAAANLGFGALAALAQSFRHQPADATAASRLAAEARRIDGQINPKAA